MFEQITAPVQIQIGRYSERLEETLASDVGLAQEMVCHLLKHRGKRLRPALLLLTAEAVGRCSDIAVDAAVGIEIIQTATLIHDDLVDAAGTRRGAVVLNRIWGNRAAVLMGDLLLARALELLVGLGSLDVMGAATRATSRMIEGEILEIQSGTATELATYFTTIDKKTASFMALACEVGAILGGGTRAQVSRMASFGKKVGIAFQITDDLLDFVGDEELLGKPVGGDVREKKLTLPLLRALANCRNGDAGQIRTKVERGVETEEDWQEVLQFVRRYRGIEDAKAEAETYGRSALRNLQVLDGSRARRALELTVQQVVEREH